MSARHKAGSAVTLPTVNRLLRYFRFDHLPSGPLRNTSAQCEALAAAMDAALPDSAEKTAGLRKLLEAKDCFVRAALPDEEPQP